jgi:hypothetical protein
MCSARSGAEPGPTRGIRRQTRYDQDELNQLVQRPYAAAHAAERIEPPHREPGHAPPTGEGRHGRGVSGVPQLPRGNEAVHPGQFPEALRGYVEMVKSKKGDVNDMTLALLHDIRMATLN